MIDYLDYKLCCFFHMKLLFSGKGLLGFSVRICTFGKQNVEKQVAMVYYVDICVILCKDPVKEMKHGEFSGGKKGCLQSNDRNRS